MPKVLLCTNKLLIFSQYYLTTWNTAYPNNQQPWIVTEPDAALVPGLGLHQKAEKYVADGVMLFEIVPDDSPGVIPPLPHLASLDEVTNLPILIPESALKERWIDGTRVDLRGNPVHNNWEA